MSVAGKKQIIDSEFADTTSATVKKTQRGAHKLVVDGVTVPLINGKEFVGKNISVAVPKVYTTTVCGKDGVVRSYKRAYIPKNLSCFDIDKEIQVYMKTLKRHRDDERLQAVLDYLKQLNIEYLETDKQFKEGINSLQEKKDLKKPVMQLQ